MQCNNAGGESTIDNGRDAMSERLSVTVRLSQTGRAL